MQIKRHGLGTPEGSARFDSACSEHIGGVWITVLPPSPHLSVFAPQAMCLCPLFSPLLLLPTTPPLSNPFLFTWLNLLFSLSSLRLTCFCRLLWSPAFASSHLHSLPLFQLFLFIYPSSSPPAIRYFTHCCPPGPLLLAWDPVLPHASHPHSGFLSPLVCLCRFYSFSL